MSLYRKLYQSVMGKALDVMDIKEPDKIMGEDSFYGIPQILHGKGVKKPLIFASRRIIEGEAFQKMCAGMDFVSFSEVHSDPEVSTIEEAVQLYHSKNCDSLVAIGGGSQIDAAKACAARIAQPHKSLKRLGGTLKVRKKIPCFIAVPTTAGTGSECTIAAVVTDEKTHHKYAIQDPCLVPDIAILDPNLTISLPPSLTAQTGMDALTHAIEAYLNVPYHQKDTELQCEKAVQIIMKQLPVAYRQPDNLKAREGMLEASYQAGRAFTVACVGNVHAIAHTFGGLYHIPHGLANAIILPYVLEDYGNVISSRLATLARLCEIGHGTNEECAKAFINRIKAMNWEMNIPSHIENVKEEDFSQMVKWANQEANPLYPVPVVYDEEHFMKIIKQVTGK